MLPDEVCTPLNTAVMVPSVAVAEVGPEEALTDPQTNAFGMGATVVAVETGGGATFEAVVVVATVVVGAAVVAVGKDGLVTTLWADR